MLNKGKFGKCNKCEWDLLPVWFEESEREITKNGVMIYTGRKRMAVSHLICECCNNSECVDDSFDGNWYK